MQCYGSEQNQSTNGVKLSFNWLLDGCFLQSCLLSSFCPRLGAGIDTGSLYLCNKGCCKAQAVHKNAMTTPMGFLCVNYACSNMYGFELSVFGLKEVSCAEAIGG
jgi:hypothetical protein